MLINIALLSVAVISTPVSPVRHQPVYRPRIELWTHRGDGAVYTRGERVELYFRLDQDAYVTIFRVDTDGRVRVLFPREPYEDNFARGGRDFEVDGDQLGRDAFAIDDYPGVGYLFAVAAPDPFIYDQIENSDHWDYRVIAEGRVRGDPYVALTDLAQRIVPEGYADWDYDVVTYNVERHYDYPRFLCYDCHSYVSYSSWDPYYESCVRFRIFVYDDPWYYPYRYYGGSRVVYVRPYRPQPRFIFKDWGASRPSREGFVTRERERPVNDNTRRGVTRRDLDGLGIVPPPNVRDRRVQTGTDGGGGNIRVDSRGGRGRNDDAGNTNDRPSNDGGGRRGTEGSSERPMVLPPRERQQEPVKVEPRRDEPRRVEPRSEPRQDEPRRVEPRNEPRNEPRSQPRVEPRNEPRNEPRSQPRAEPRNEPRNQPRAEPRSQPRAEPAREKPRNEPEVRRRKP